MKQLSKLPLLILLSWRVPWSFSWIYANGISNQTFSINRAVEMILDSCYSDYRTIMTLIGSEPFSSRVLDFQSLATIKMANPSVISTKHEKLNLFLTTANSGDELEQRLLFFKNSPWWNIMATFFILGDHSSCKNARTILKTSWKMNIPTSFYLCRNSRRRLMIYSYNPYTNRAPRPWKKIENASNQPGDGWTMYERPYRTEGVCAGMKFDRTKFLDGSTIKIVASRAENDSWLTVKQSEGTTYETMYPEDARVAEAMKYAFNATTDITLVPDNINYSAKIQECFVPLLDGSSDMALCLRSPLATYNFPISYPELYVGFTIVTQRRGYYTPLEKIANYYGYITLVSMIIILAMTFVVVVRIDKKKRFSFGAFEALRLVVNASLHTKMDTLASRIFFAVILLYFLIIQATFQGRISAFLTKEEERRNVQHIKDLRDPTYSVVYAGKESALFVEDPLVQSKLVIPENGNCFMQVIGDPGAACIGIDYWMLRGAMHYGLHHIEKSFGHFFMVYASRHEWPLKERLDMYIMRLESSGLSVRWNKAELQDFLTQHEIIRVMSEVQVSKISLEMLTFAFYILGVGLACATICFFCEIAIAKRSEKQKRRVKSFHVGFLDRFSGFL